MLALYRSGRQAEALDVFRRARTELVDQFGIEPGSALRAMERAILQQDATLDLEPARTDEPQAILLVASRDDALDELVASRSAASSLARADPVVRLTADEDELASAAAAANAHCRRFSGDARTAVFTSGDWVDDATRLADSYVAQLVLVDAAEGIEGEHLPNELAALLDRSAADVGIVAGAPRVSGEIFVPFGGGEHDWAALELATWLAAAAGTELVLFGRALRPAERPSGCSRLLQPHAALAAQRLAGVSTRPGPRGPITRGLARSRRARRRRDHRPHGELAIHRHRRRQARTRGRGAHHW